MSSSAFVTHGPYGGGGEWGWGLGDGEGGLCGRSLYILLSFAVNLKLLQKIKMGVPVMAQRNRIRLGTMRLRV